MSTTRDDDGLLVRLYRVLDETDISSGEQFELNPVPALEKARIALRNNTELLDALGPVEQQIRVFRMALRGLLLEITKEVGDYRALTPELVRGGLCELHLSAFHLLRKIGDARARQHLISAIACESGNLLPKRLLVEDYLTEQDYRAAVDTLDSLIRDDLDAAFALFELAADIAERSNVDSIFVFERASKRDSIGLIRDMCAYRLRQNDGAASEPPSIDTLNDRYRTAGNRLMQQRDREASIAELVSAIAWSPRWPGAWFFLGIAYRQALPSFGDYQPTDAQGNALGTSTNLTPLIPVPLGDTAYNDLCRATQAFRVAAGLDPDFAEASNELAGCELQLDRPFLALPPAQHYCTLRPDEAAAHSNLSTILVRTGDLDGASKEAAAALQRDPRDPVAHATLAQLREFGDQA